MPAKNPSSAGIVKEWCGELCNRLFSEKELPLIKMFRIETFNSFRQKLLFFSFSIELCRKYVASEQKHFFFKQNDLVLNVST